MKTSKVSKFNLTNLFYAIYFEIYSIKVLKLKQLL